LKLALFDLDGTLIPGDSDHAFGEFLIAQGLADGESYRRRNDAFYADYQQGRLDIAAYVAFCTAPWRALALGEQRALQQRFMAEVIEPMLKPAAFELVERHRAAGDLLAIVTATNDFITRPVAERLGVPTLIATELARDAQGRASGAIAGVPAFRDGKVARVGQWLAEMGLALGRVERSTFYSDSPNDLPLLEAVSHPVATNPAPALRALALERGWPVLDLLG
jgi:HAD superfamily hydrolase (TIGR01490 family)